MSTDIIANRYRIVREIARSNDVVYEAIDQSMGRRLAVKELSLPPNLTGQAKRERIERFNREARAAGKLQHPNIVTVYNFGEADGRHFIAMEYLEGGTLRDAIQSRGALPLQEALEIASQVLSALSHAHANKVIHRDVKPDNIHLLAGGQVKLTDFGIARLTEEASLTGEGQVFGTPSYMSPEQIEGRFIDHRSDLFSLAVLLYEMLSGRKPFTGDSVVSITYSIMHNDPPALVGVPFGVEQVIFRALKKDPGQRYNSAEEMRQALKNADAVPSMFLPRQPTNLGGSFGAPAYPPSSPYGQPYSGPPSIQPGPYGPSPLGAGLPPAIAPLFPGLPGNTAYAPPPQPAMPAQTGGGPFVNWGAPQPGYPPGYGAPPAPPYVQRRDGPLVPKALGDFLKVLALAVALGGLVVALVILFLHAYEQQQQRKASDAIYRLLNDGKKLYESGDLERAAAKFEEAYKASPSSKAGNDAKLSLAITLNRLGTKAYDRGDLKQAETYWYHALDFDADNNDVHYNLGKLYDRMGNHDRALEEWQHSSGGGRVGGPNPAAPGSSTAMQSHYEQARLYFNAGTDAYNRGETDAARENWQKALGEAPGTDIAARAQEYLARTESGPSF